MTAPTQEQLAVAEVLRQEFNRDASIYAFLDMAKAIIAALDKLKATS